MTAMNHESDPRVGLMEKVRDVLPQITLYNNQVLVAIYVRPEKTKGGILLTDQTRREDEFQGKVGLVLKKGPTAFLSDNGVNFYGQDVAAGDWVCFRASDGWSLKLGGVLAKVVEDVHIRARITEPDAVY